jgi:hypothetical protein
MSSKIITQCHTINYLQGYDKPVEAEFSVIEILLSGEDEAGGSFLPALREFLPVANEGHFASAAAFYFLQQRFRWYNPKRVLL